MEQPLITLNCWAIGGTVDTVFSVEISPTANISKLKQIIWNENQPHYSLFPHFSLKIFKVDIPIEEFDNVLKDIASPDDVEETQAPGPFQTIDEIFDVQILNRKHIHILVQPPPSAMNGIYPILHENDNVRKDLWRAYTQVVKEARHGQSPSINVMPHNYSAHQDSETPIHDGRYGGRRHLTLAPPIELYHRVFADFKANVDNKSLQPPSDIVRSTAELMEVTMEIEQQRTPRIRPTRTFLANMLCNELAQKDDFDMTSSDRIVFTVPLFSLKETAAIAIFEETSELGWGGDPSVKSSFNYLRFWSQTDHDCIRGATCCPTFLIGIAGPWIVIMGAVLTDVPIVQRLTDFLWVGHSRVIGDRNALRLARIFYSLKLALTKLHKYYLDLPSPLKGSPARFFPSITSFKTNNEIVRFRYERPLESRPTCVTFLATQLQIDDSDDKKIVVKFAEQYGERAHKLLASKGMAPELFFCGPAQHDSEQLMVVMEYIEGESLSSRYGGRDPIPSKIYASIRTATKLLAQNFMVHGDLRRQNIFVTDADDKVMLIDFDWAGNCGEVKYPLHLSTGFGLWVTGVGDYNPIQLDHDTRMVDRL